MGYQGAYAKALLGVDVANESIKERRELEKAQSDREKEEGIKSLAGTVLSIAGSAFGPIGSFVGKTIGTLGADALMKSEKSHVSRGKFKAYESDEINKELNDYDRDSNIANAMNIGTSALTSFMMAGGTEGLKETLGADKSFMDFATSWNIGDETKVSLAKWMKMSGAEKAASNIGNVSYFEYLLGMDGKEKGLDIVADKMKPHSKYNNQFLIPDWQKSQGGYGDSLLNLGNPFDGGIR